METQNTLLWKGFAASIPGFGHIRRDIPCQDASLAVLACRPALIVCDGRGSAAHSHFGSRAAVKMFRSQIAILEPVISSILDNAESTEESWHNFCRIMCRALAQVKLDLAEERNLSEKEFDFTVAFAVTGKKHIGCFQIGDGAIVLRQNSTCITAFQPEKGEFANQTAFLRSGCDQLDKFQTKLFPAEENSGIAITSDGPEHVMFKLPEMLPSKVFAVMFDDLLADNFNRQGALDYLTDRRWNDDPQGSDDRSLAMIVPVHPAGGQPDEPSHDDTTDEEIPDAAETEEEKDAPDVETADDSTQDIPVENHKSSIGKRSVYTAVAALLAICTASGIMLGFEAEQLLDKIEAQEKQIDFLHKTLNIRSKKCKTLLRENQLLRYQLKKYNTVQKGD